jgi:hypothetical protein
MVTFKKRPGPNRRYLFILMIMMVIQIIPFYGEATIAFLYVRTRFGWEVDEYSQYSSIVSSIGIVGEKSFLSPLDLIHTKHFCTQYCDIAIKRYFDFSQ